MPSSKPTSSPRKRRRPSSGSRVSIRTSAPQAAAKSFSRASRRSSPGDDTSSRYGHRDRVGRVEVRLDLTRHVGAAFHGDPTVTARRVDGDAQQPGRAAPREQDVDEFETRVFDDRFDQSSSSPPECPGTRHSDLQTASSPQTKKADISPLSTPARRAGTQPSSALSGSLSRPAGTTRGCSRKPA